MPTSPSSAARSAASPPAAAKTQRNGPTWTARISLLAIPLLAVALSRRRGPRVFTKAELARYVDTQNGLKVAICGQVFDVTKGAEFYAKGAGYGFFAGRDASLAFATGNFRRPLLRVAAMACRGRFKLRGACSWRGTPRSPWPSRRFEPTSEPSRISQNTQEETTNITTTEKRR